MNSLHRPFMKFIAILSMVVLLFCVTLTKGHSAGQAGQRQGADKSKPPGCPDLSLEGFEKIDFAKITALQPNGISGLPCDAEA